MASVTWALGSAVYGVLSVKHSPYAVNFSRTLVSFPLFLIITLVFVKHPFQTVGWYQVGWFTISMISSYVLADALFFMSIRSLGLPGAMAIASTYPLWSALAGWLFKGETLGPLRVGGLFLAVTGSALVILSQRSRAQIPRAGLQHPTTGVLLGLATSLLWSVNAFGVSRAGAGLPTAEANAIRLGVAFILCPLMGAIIAGPKKMFLTRAEFVKTLPVFFVESFAGSYFFMYGMTHSPLAVGASLSSLSPVVSVPIALAMGWEKPSAIRILGVLAVVAGVCLLVGN